MIDRVARRLVRAVPLLLLALSGACHRKKPGDPPSPSSGPFTVYVAVSNQGFFDVNVYLMRAPGSVGRRLGTVTGNNSTVFRFQDTELQAGGRLQLNARAIGSRSTWISPEMSVGPGMVARLVLVSNPNGDLSRSQFFLDTSGGDDAAYRFQALTTASPMRAMTVFPSLSPQ